MNKPVVLVVEDDVPVRNLMITTLKTHDYKYLTAADGAEAILLASSHNPDFDFMRRSRNSCGAAAIHAAPRQFMPAKRAIHPWTHRSSQRARGIIICEFNEY